MSGPVLSVRSKVDLAEVLVDGAIAISARSGQGMDALLAALEAEVRRLAGSSGTAVLTRARHRLALEDAALHLALALENDLAELRGEELRLAVQALGRITGAVGVEEVLDSVFGQFCIGK
jgi:tRNA modification GTPase